MSVLYLREHTACHNYKKENDYQQGFSYFIVSKGELADMELLRNTLVFIIDGVAEVIVNGNKITLQTEEVIFHPRQSHISYKFLTDSKVLIASFKELGELCEIVNLSTLIGYSKDINYKPAPFKVNERITMFLNLLSKVLEDGGNCDFYHNVKLRELFFLFRFYYTKKELATLFYPIVNNSYMFKQEVLSKYKDIKTVNELAKACNMSLSAFKERFNKEFGKAPGEWLIEQKLKVIKQRLLDKSVLMKTIALELDFESLSDFSKFCKRHTGLSPTELQQQLCNKLEH